MLERPADSVEADHRCGKIRTSDETGIARGGMKLSIGGKDLESGPAGPVPNHNEEVRRFDAIGFGLPEADGYRSRPKGKNWQKPVS